MSSELSLDSCQVKGRRREGWMNVSSHLPSVLICCFEACLIFLPRILRFNLKSTAKVKAIRTSNERTATLKILYTGCNQI